MTWASILFITWFMIPAIFPASSIARWNASAMKVFKETCAAAKLEGRAVGVGIGCFVETSGIGPWEYARIEVDNAGKVVLYSGCNSVGQGIATALSQIVADELQVAIDDCARGSWRHGESSLRQRQQRQPFDGDGRQRRGRRVAQSQRQTPAAGLGQVWKSTPPT